MTVYIGVDFHPYEQTVAYVDENDGEIRHRQFRHTDKAAIKTFYNKKGTDAVIGVEATGSLWWFERLLASNGQKLLIGDPRLIRRVALSRHKNDFRDADTILDLLVDSRFPELRVRSEESRLILQALIHRRSLVQKRTSTANQLQAFARQKGLDKFRMTAKPAPDRLLGAASENETETLVVRSRLTLYETLSREIALMDEMLNKEADKEKDATRLRTHPGIGVLTSLALVHTLGDVKRFRRKEEVVAFAGLDPLDHSSGEKRRIGHISKHGSPLLRYLLGQAAQTCRAASVREHYLSVSRRRGRPKAKVAAARKLLINCYVMLRDGIDYQEFARRGAKLACTMGQERR
ncbi:MAG: IS110 family transposase [Pyrinomonadaceae bacterium]